MSYVQGMVAAVPEANREAYRRHAEKVGALLRENGALEMVECWGVDVPEGKVTSFPNAVQCKQGEVVVFSWIIWPSKEASESGWRRARADERFQCEEYAGGELLDGKRLIFGGFDILTRA